MRVRRATVNDAESLRAIYCDPGVMPFITDDGVRVDTIDFSVIAGSATCYFLIAEHAGQDIGMFLFYPMNTITYELHTAFLPGKRGRLIRVAARLAREYMFAETPCRKVITYVPVDNRAALLMGKLCGLTVEGRVTGSFLRNGHMLDQFILGTGGRV